MRGLEEKGHELEERISRQVSQAAKRLADVADRAAAYVREHPGRCLVAALAFGYLVGWRARRS
jgi:ElaB/YqjD/DUF883 family membrane-anchored ribosome-binding protein